MGSDYSRSVPPAERGCSVSEDLIRTPLYEEHLALGARMMPFAGYEMPVQYVGIIEEHRAVRSRVGIFDVCHMAEFRVFGFGAFDFLQRTLTNDLTKISALGKAQYTLMLDEDGGILDDLVIYHSGDLEYLIIANASNRAADLRWLTSLAPDGVDLVDESDRTGLIAVQGPEALSVITDLAGAEWVAPRRFTVAEAMLDNAIPCLVARTGYTGEDGVEILCRATDAPVVWRLLLSFPQVAPAGLGARDTLRLEMGYHLYGSDMDSSIDPISAGLGWVVNADKGPFIGSAAVAEIRAKGPSTRLSYLRLEGAIPRPGHPILHEGSVVGKVASGTFSPTLECGIATAYLPAPLAVVGTEFEVTIRKKSVTARVATAPFVTSTSLSAS
jgi:aminomethyltransferase